MGFRENDIVVNWRSAVVFTWNAETAVKYGKELFSLRIANEDEERRYLTISKATGRKEIRTIEIGIKLRGKGVKHRNFSQGILINDPTLYLMLRHFQKDIEAENMEDLIRDLLDKKRRLVQVNTGSDPNVNLMVEKLINVFTEATESLKRITSKSNTDNQ